MLALFVSKILCSVMNLTVCYYVLDFCQDQLGKRAWKVLLYDDVVCFLVVLDSIFETLAHIWATLRSLLNELACLTVFSTVKQASSFNRDLRVIDSLNIKSYFFCIIQIWAMVDFPVLYTVGLWAKFWNMNSSVWIVWAAQGSKEKKKNISEELLMVVF